MGVSLLSSMSRQSCSGQKSWTKNMSKLFFRPCLPFRYYVLCKLLLQTQVKLISCSADSCLPVQRIWNDGSVIRRSSVDSRAAASTIKVSLIGHLVSRGPLTASFCPRVFIHNGKAVTCFSVITAPPKPSFHPPAAGKESKSRGYRGWSCRW